MLSLGLKKVFKGLKFDFKNPADTRLYYGTIWSNCFFFNKPFLTILLRCFENVL